MVTMGGRIVHDAYRPLNFRCHFSSSFGASSSAPIRNCLTEFGRGEPVSAKASAIAARSKGREEKTVRTATTDGYARTIDEIGASGLEIKEIISSLILSFSSTVAKIVQWSAVRLTPPKSNVQMIIETAIIDCRFFTLLPVAGSLLGSALCFLEGSRLVFQAYQRNFKPYSGGQDYMVLLMDGIDMFMVATALLTFGVGIYMMFVAPPSSNKETTLAHANIMKNIKFESTAVKASTQSLTEVKSKIGQAILMILQTGILEKFKQVHVGNCLDLACMGATILVSSLCMLILSRLCNSRFWRSHACN